MYTQKAFVAETWRNGAHGYVIKDSALSELVQAVREVATGAFLTRPSPRKSSTGTRQSPARSPAKATFELTARERDVVQLATAGLGNNELGTRPLTSPRTAEIHRAAVMKKLGLNNHTAPVTYAVKRGIV